MTALAQLEKRVSDLERNSGNHLDGLIIFSSIVWPNPDGEPISKLSRATGIGWSLTRNDDETEEDFEARAKEAARTALEGLS